MKYLLFIAFLASCSSHHNDPAPDPNKVVVPFTPAAGEVYATFEKEMGKPDQCVEFSDYKYCEWKAKNQINHFRGDKYVSQIEAPKKSLNWEIDRESMAGEEKASKAYQVLPGAKRLSVSGLEWKKHYPKIEKTLKSLGLQLGKNDQQLKVNFGLKDLPGKTVKRYLTFSAAQKNDELWKVNVSSIGTSRDLNQAMPVLLLAAYDLVGEPSNETKSMVINDGQLSVVGFKHFLQSK